MTMRIRTHHRPRVSRTGRKHPWRVECACGIKSEWRFWRNAINRATRHVSMPGVYR